MSNVPNPSVILLQGVIKFCLPVRLLVTVNQLRELAKMEHTSISAIVRAVTQAYLAPTSVGAGVSSASISLT